MKSVQSTEKALWRQVAAVFFLPAIGLCLLGYRVQGVRCRYRLGNFDVTPLEPVSQKQYLLMRVFPLLAGLVVAGPVGGLVYLLNIPIG